MARQGMARHGKARHGMVGRGRSKAGHGSHGRAGHENAPHGRAGQENAPRGAGQENAPRGAGPIILLGFLFGLIQCLAARGGDTVLDGSFVLYLPIGDVSFSLQTVGPGYSAVFLRRCSQ